MDIEELRKGYLAEIEAAAADIPVPTPEAVASLATSNRHDPRKLGDLIDALPLDQRAYGPSVRTLLDILGDDSLDPTPRLAALRRLGAAEFQPAEFATFHAEYVELLRRLALSPDENIRTGALERLTLTNDQEAQRLLREGLEGIRKPPLVPPAKAIQLLARDDHGSSLPLFRRLAASATGQVREQALRALATDARSVPLFERIAADKRERTQIRRVAAVNLKNVSASRFARLASGFVLDSEESDALRAIAATAIAHSSDVAVRLRSPAFAKSVSALGASTGSRALRTTIRRLAKRLAADEA